MKRSGVGRSGMKYYEAVMNPTEKQIQAQKDRWARRTKEQKAMVVKQLTQYGFEVNNITSRKLPFELVIEQPPTVVAISHHTMGYNYFVYDSRLTMWEEFKTSARKVVIFVMSGQALRFIHLCEIYKYSSIHHKGYLVPCRDVLELSVLYKYI